MPPSEIRQSVGESENVKLHNAIPARKIKSTNFHLKVTSIFSKVACLFVLKNQASMKCMHKTPEFTLPEGGGGRCGGAGLAGGALGRGGGGRLGSNP